jgi:hypothetical protein
VLNARYHVALPLDDSSPQYSARPLTATHGGRVVVQDRHYLDQAGQVL